MKALRALTLMLVVLASTHLRLKLGPDLVEQLRQAADAVAGRRGAHAAVVAAVHRHGWAGWGVVDLERIGL